MIHKFLYFVVPLDMAMPGTEQNITDEMVPGTADRHTVEIPQVKRAVCLYCTIY
jgi:hypothetical protein